MPAWVFRENSLDAIRLLAASQVAILHSLGYIYPAGSDHWAIKILEIFPGVPIFFFVSGFLISRSYERSPQVLSFAKNRILRLYPALILCVGVNLLLVASTGYFDTAPTSRTELATLFFAKATFFQFWNPEFMRAFGDGVLNGSLWTICVELQFYILVPVFYKIFSNENKLNNWLLIALTVIFLLFNRLMVYSEAAFSEYIMWKLYRVSFAPWFYMFLVGIFCQNNFAIIAKYLSRIPAVLVLLFYCIYSGTLINFGLATGNGISPIIFPFLILLIFRMSYCGPEKINRLLKGNDISYGLYIWHMPIVNQMLYYKYSGSISYFILAISLSFIAGVASWVLIEKPALKLKNSTLNINLAKYSKKK